MLRDDYARWMREDPRVNFADSRRGHQAGLNHLGFQVDEDSEFRDMRTRLATAEASLTEQTGQPCCDARSDKYWVTDPQGIAWETFHALESIPVFGEDHTAEAPSNVCCIPLPQVNPAQGRGMQAGDDASCCVPTSAQAAASGRCC